MEILKTLIKTVYEKILIMYNTTNNITRYEFLITSEYSKTKFIQENL